MSTKQPTTFQKVLRWALDSPQTDWLMVGLLVVWWFFPR
jgi:hypothetical protein